MVVRSITLVFLYAIYLSAQVSTGAIEGTVSDSTGAVVTGASVTVTNTDTSLVRTLVTDESGIYRAPLLPAGKYKVEASHAGFQSRSKVGLVLSIDQTLTVNIDLAVGDVQQSVEVVGRAEQLVQAATSNLGQVIEEAQIRELPINGRNFQQLISLNTGSQPGPQGGFSSGNFHINGGRGEGNAFLVDGLDVSSSYSDAVRINPSLESVGEFKILTNNYSAEYGRSVGGVISVRLKGGGNEHHGTLFHFFRNEKLDARNFFAATKLPFKFNQFGGSLGGPIIRNKLFYFADYQGTRQRSSSPGFYTVPDAAQRNGNLSALPASTVIYDPLTNPRQPFPGNVIPRDRLDPAVASMMALLPLPNATGIFNFQTTLPTIYDADAFDTRIDYNINERNTLSGSFSLNNIDGKTGTPFGPISGQLITTDAPHNRPRRISLLYTRVFSPSTVNQLTVGYARDRWFGPATEGHQYTPDAGIRYLNTSEDDMRTTGYPLLIISGFSFFGGPAGAPFNHVQNLPQVSDSFTWSKGRHLIKFGGAFKARQFNMDQSIWPRGLLSFNPLMTSNGGAGGNALASALLGYPLSASRDLATPWGQRNKEYDFYFQDDWKATSRLTLNIGLRYDLFLPATEAYDRLTNFDMDTKTLVGPGQNGRSKSTVETNNKLFGPHLGFAYLLTKDQRTVLRGGYRIGYLPLMTSAPGTVQRLPMNPPYRLNFSTVFNFLAPTVRVSDGLLIPPADLNNPSGDIYYIPESQPFPYMQQWNLNIQRSLTKDLLLDVAYAASRGVHLTGLVNLNQAPPGEAPPATRAPISPAINNLVSLLNRESSIYHSLQIKLERRFAAGFYLLGAYTFSKSIDDGSYTAQSSDASSVQPMDSRNWRLERALSDFDVRNRLVVSYIYELPFGKGKAYLNSAHAAVDALLGGWQINGITTLQNGQPFTPTVANNRANAGPGGSVRPNRLANGNLPTGERTIGRWFDRTAFAAPPPFQFGNSGRNVLTGPGYANWDFSLFKNFVLHEDIRLQFRGEFFNLMNRANFNLPNATVDTPQSGIITGSRPARQIQLALKLVF